MRKRYSEFERESFLREYEASGLTQREYAGKRGISVSYLQKLLRKKPISATECLAGGFVELAPSAGMGPNRGSMIEVQFPSGLVVKIGGD